MHLISRARTTRWLALSRSRAILTVFISMRSSVVGRWRRKTLANLNQNHLGALLHCARALECVCCQFCVCRRRSRSSRAVDIPLQIRLLEHRVHVDRSFARARSLVAALVSGAVCFAEYSYKIWIDNPYGRRLLCSCSRVHCLPTAWIGSFGSRVPSLHLTRLFGLSC